MLHRLLSMLLIVAGMHVRGNGEARIASLHLKGNTRLSDHEIVGVMLSRQGAVFFQELLSRDLKAVEAEYQHQGYDLARIALDSVRWSADSLFVDLYLGVFEGPKVEIGEIRLRGNTALQTEAIMRQFETRPGKILDQVVLEQDLRSLIASYERIGYPFAAVRVQELALTGDSISPRLRLEIAVDEGSKVVLSEIRVTGNKETHEHVIVRETRIAPNEVYNEDKVSKIPQRLNRLNIFSSVGEPQVYVNPAGGGLLLTVQEGNTNTFDGILGYLPAARTDEGGYITGLISVSMRNLFGTARRLDVRWQRDGKESQEVGFNYSEPWLFDLPLNLTAGFSQRQQDSLYVKRNVEAKAVLMFADAFSISGSIAREEVIPSSSLSQAFVSSSHSVYAGIELRFDTRDDIVSPTSGANYRTGYEIGTKNSAGNPGASPIPPQSNVVQRVGLDAELYTSLFLRQVIMFGIHARQITSDNLEIGDRYRFGGANSLRGYRENQFLGSRIAWTNAEYRFLLARRSFFYLFIDNGYYYVPADAINSIASVQAFKYGFGIGIRLDTSLGNIGLSVALGEGDAFNEAKVHVGLINDF